MVPRFSGVRRAGEVVGNCVDQCRDCIRRRHDGRLDSKLRGRRGRHRPDRRDTRSGQQRRGGRRPEDLGEIAHGGGAGERHYVHRPFAQQGVQLGTAPAVGPHRAVGGGLGHVRARCAQCVREHFARDVGAREQHPRARQAARLAQRFEDRLGAVLRRHHVHLEAIPPQPPGCRRPDGAQPHAAQRANVTRTGEQPLQEGIDPVHRREHDPVERRGRVARGVERSVIFGRRDADGRRLDRFGAQVQQTVDELGRLLPCPRDEHAPPGQRAVVEPPQLLPELDDLSYDQHARSVPQHFRRHPADVAQRAVDGSVGRQGPVDDQRSWIVSGSSRGQEVIDERLQTGGVALADHGQARRGEIRPAGAAQAALTPAHEHHGVARVRVAERNAREAGIADRPRDAGHDLERDAERLQRLRLPGAAVERVAVDQACNRLSRGRLLREQPGDGVRIGGLLLDGRGVDPLHGGTDHPQLPGVNQVVVDDYVGALQIPQAAHADQCRLARSGADQVHASRFHGLGARGETPRRTETGQAPG